MLAPQLPITREQFESLSFFQGVSFDSLVGYLESASITTLEAGCLVISPKVEQRFVFVVLTGTLEVRLDALDGLIVALLGSGECAGEMSVFDHTDPSAWVLAQTKVELLAFHPNTMLAMIEASHDLALNLLQILSRRVRYGNQTLSAGSRNLQRIERTATVDSLTGLHNRRWMDNMFQREITRSLSGDLLLCLLIADIDHFKKVNDEHGHLVGDRILASVAKSITMSLRPNDMLVRYGGEEFAILLPGAGLEIAAKVAERIRLGVAMLEDKDDIKVTISLGISMLRKDDGLNSLIARADAALYDAKNSGRNKTCLESS